MLGEIIAIGNELTSGRILNTNSRFAAGQLFSAGHEIMAMATIGDTPAKIGEALKRAIRRSDFVIVTGGLGPTTDDITNKAVADALDRPSTLYPEILEKIKLQLADSPMPEGVTLEKLAWLPEGAEVLKPEARMAGYLLVHHEKPIFFLPGVPHEMRELLAERVIPWLALWQGGEARQVKQGVYKIFGLTETEINSRLNHLEDSADVRIGYYPVFPDVHLNLTVMTKDAGETGRIFSSLATEIEATLGDHIFGMDEETMAGVVGRLLSEQGKTLAAAESCSGGLMAHKITSVPGSSGYFAGGVVAYSNALKECFLDVSPETLMEHGAVSAPTAIAMARGVRSRTGADIGISVTGIAGPTGGTAAKPVGTVFIGLADDDETYDFQFLFPGDRWQIQEMTAQTALNLVRLHLLNKPLTSIQ